MNEQIKTDCIGMLDVDGWNESTKRIHGIDGVSPTLNTCQGGGHETKIAEPCIMRKFRTPEGRELRKKGIDVFANREMKPCPDGLSNTLTSVEKDNYLCEPHIAASHGRGANWEQNLESRNDGCTNTLTRVEKDNYVVEPKFRIRKLTPTECFRLMGCDEPTIEKLLNSGISNSQLYKLAGNSIVVDVLTAIFDKMLVHTESTVGEQLTLF